jgi:hypothetical protein
MPELIESLPLREEGTVPFRISTATIGSDKAGREILKIAVKEIGSDIGWGMDFRVITVPVPADPIKNKAFFHKQLISLMAATGLLVDPYDLNSAVIEPIRERPEAVRSFDSLSLSLALPGRIFLGEVKHTKAKTDQATGTYYEPREDIAKFMPIKDKATGGLVKQPDLPASIMAMNEAMPPEVQLDDDIEMPEDTSLVEEPINVPTE